MEICKQSYDDNITRIVETYSDLLLRLALHHTAELATAEDIVQTAFLRCMTSAPAFQSDAHERAWLIRTTVNLCHDYYRSAFQRKRATYDDETLADLQQEPQEDFGEVLGAVRSLPERERTAVYLYYYLGLPVKEVARIMQEKKGTVASRLYRARAHLKTLLKGAYDYE